MRVLDLFSGIGGISLGLEAAGMRTVQFVEINRFCRRVLAKHWPGVSIHDDVRTVELQPGGAEVVCGGFPCQDVSLAGRRAGLAGERSGLYRELVRALRVVRPRHAIVENVAALLGDGMGTVLGDMAASGFDAEWDCVPACALGAPHERDRVWIVAHANGMREPQPPVSRHEVRMGSGSEAQEPCRPIADTQGIGCGSGRPGRPPDSFARVRDAARRNAADTDRAGLQVGPDERGSLSTAAQRGKIPATRGASCPHVGWAEWPDEPALLGVDDGVPNRVDRVRALGNAVIPQIPELIGRALVEMDQ